MSEGTAGHWAIYKECDTALASGYQVKDPWKLPSEVAAVAIAARARRTPCGVRRLDRLI
jgi:hypothetical protein